MGRDIDFVLDTLDLSPRPIERVRRERFGGSHVFAFGQRSFVPAATRRLLVSAAELLETVFAAAGRCGTAST